MPVRVLQAVADVVLLAALDVLELLAERPSLTLSRPGPLARVVATLRVRAGEA